MGTQDPGTYREEQDHLRTQDPIERSQIICGQNPTERTQDPGAYEDPEPRTLQRETRNKTKKIYKCYKFYQCYDD